MVLIFAGFYLISDVKKSHDNKHILFINDLMVKIENGELLDSIENLRQRKAEVKKNKKSSVEYFKRLWIRH